MKTESDLQIESLHCRAICEEIGYRLSLILPPENSYLPARLQILIDKLADQDRNFATSIAPDFSDMIWQVERAA